MAERKSYNPKAFPNLWTLKTLESWGCPQDWEGALLNGNITDEDYESFKGHPYETTTTTTTKKTSTTKKDS